MSSRNWIPASAAVVLLPPLLAVVGAGPAAARAVPDRAQLRPAGHRLVLQAPAGAARAAAAPGSALQVTQACDPADIAVRQSTTCTVTASNTGPADTTVDLNTLSSLHLHMTGATGARVTTPFTAKAPRASLAGVRAAGPVSVAPDPGNVFGYIPLTVFGGNTIIPLGDEEIFNLDVPGFVFNDTSYNKIGITSNGYLVAGGGDQADVAAGGTVPDPARPNAVIAPYWTDLDGGGAPGVLANVLTDGVSSWIVVEWQVRLHDTTAVQVFQVWLGTNGVQDIQYAYKFDTLLDAGSPLVVGAENADGTVGARLTGGLPTADLRVTSDAGQAGGSVSYTVTLRGLVRGTGQVLTVARSPILARPITVSTPVTVTR